MFLMKVYAGDEGSHRLHRLKKIAEEAGEQENFHLV